MDLNYVVETLACKPVIAGAGRDTAQTIDAVVWLMRELIGYGSTVTVGLFYAGRLPHPIECISFGIGLDRHAIYR